MWRWLPNALCNKTFGCISERRLFFLQLFGIVFGMHLFIFGFYGFVTWISSGQDRYKISLTASGATYVLMPFQKRVDQGAGQKNRLQNPDETRALKKSNVIDQQTYDRKKKASKNSKTTESKSLAVHSKNKKSSKSTKSSAKQTASVMMKAEKKSSVVSKKSKQKKSVTKIQEELVTKDVVVPVVEQSVMPQPIEAVQPEMVEPEVVQTDDVQADVASHDDFDEDNVIFIGYEELDQAMIGSKIQHEIQQHWTPPVGMEKNVSCEIRAKIDADGQAIETKVMKSSGVFVYDAAAKKTLQKIEYPKEVFNKSITIILGS